MNKRHEIMNQNNKFMCLVRFFGKLAKPPCVKLSKSTWDKPATRRTKLKNVRGATRANFWIEYQFSSATHRRHFGTMSPSVLSARHLSARFRTNLMAFYPHLETRLLPPPPSDTNFGERIEVGARSFVEWIETSSSRLLCLFWQNFPRIPGLLGSERKIASRGKKFTHC